MRVLMQNRPDCFDFPGGDVVQMLRTKEQLEHLGVVVDVDNTAEPDVSCYDIVHVFNTLAMPTAYYQVMNAKRQGKPVVYSTIYWNVDELQQAPRAHMVNMRAKVNGLLRRFIGRELLYRECYGQSVTTWMQQEAALLASDCLLPNADAELMQIRSAFPRVRNTARIIPNGVDADVADGVAERFRSTTGIANSFVLCLANISPRKNQLRLAQACRSLGLQLVLVGGCNKDNQAYLSSCLKAGGDNVVNVGPVTHDEARDAIAACHIHVLASIVETPGLATLEAAACGKNVVVCDRGSVREYLGEQAWYCDYFSLDSIASAVSDAWNAEPDPSLSAKVMSEYTWRRAAERTLEAYRMVLSSYGRC